VSAGHDELRALLAHELKSPLAVIVGFAELLRARDDEEIRREAPERILEAAQRLQTVIDDSLLVLVPASQDQTRPAAAEATSQPGRADPGSRQRILVADDDALVRQLLSLTMPPERYEVVEAVDGAAALELAMNEPPALMLLDWRMPDRTGADVLAELARLDLSFPVIVLTAETDESQHELAHSLGATASITKPFSPVHLLATVERMLVGEHG
jgi:CheY-like chemotaxis protein